MPVYIISAGAETGHFLFESEGVSGSIVDGACSSSLKTISSGTSRTSSSTGGGRGRRGKTRVLFFTFLRSGMLALSQEYRGLARTKVTRK